MKFDFIICGIKVSIAISLYGTFLEFRAVWMVTTTCPNFDRVSYCHSIILLTKLSLRKSWKILYLLLQSNNFTLERYNSNKCTQFSWRCDSWSIFTIYEISGHWKFCLEATAFQNFGNFQCHCQATYVMYYFHECLKRKSQFSFNNLKPLLTRMANVAQESMKLFLKTILPFHS